MADFDIIMICEGVYEAENVSHLIQCWSELGKRKLYLSLQGFFSRNLFNLVEQGILYDNFEVNKDKFFEVTGEEYNEM